MIPRKLKSGHKMLWSISVNYAIKFSSYTVSCVMFSPVTDVFLDSVFIVIWNYKMLPRLVEIQFHMHKGIAVILLNLWLDDMIKLRLWKIDAVAFSYFNRKTLAPSLHGAQLQRLRSLTSRLSLVGLSRDESRWMWSGWISFGHFLWTEGSAGPSCHGFYASLESWQSPFTLITFSFVNLYLME